MRLTITDILAPLGVLACGALTYAFTIASLRAWQSTELNTTPIGTMFLALFLAVGTVGLFIWMCSHFTCAAAIGAKRAAAARDVVMTFARKPAVCAPNAGIRSRRRCW